MPRIFHPSYQTDVGLIVQVPIGYVENIQERFALGGFDDFENNRIGVYGLLLHKRLFTPRYVYLWSLGKVYFKTFSKWYEFINSTDLSDIKDYKSESGTKTCIRYFSMINRGNNGN